MENNSDGDWEISKAGKKMHDFVVWFEKNVFGFHWHFKNDDRTQGNYHMTQTL